MKFMSSFQCLMGGNVVPLQYSSSSSESAVSIQSSLVVPANKNDNRRSSHSLAKKTKKKKRKDGKVIKVFKPDGEINLYHKPIRVAEVMTEDYMVCRSDSFYIGQKIPSLSQHDRLQPGHTYFLLPTRLFHSVLSFVTIASLTASSQQADMDDTNANMKMKAAFLKKAATSSCSPFDIQKTASGTLRIRLSELFISQLLTDKAQAAASAGNHKEIIGFEAAVDLLCTTPQLHREYKQLVVGSRRVWKPKLEMIKEGPPIYKKKVKMLFSASINRMKLKMKNKKSASAPQKLSLTQPQQLKKKKKSAKKIVISTPVSLPSGSASIQGNKFSKTI